jgi:competence protein ComEC
MVAVGLVALATGVRRAAVRATAVAVPVLVEPDLVSAPGLALSVLTTANLLRLAPGAAGGAVATGARSARRRTAVPAAAQVACRPVVVAVSAERGLLSVPANLLAVPAVAPATVLAVAAALVPLLAPVPLRRRRRSSGWAVRRRPGS